MLCLFINPDGSAVCCNCTAVICASLMLHIGPHRMDCHYYACVLQQMSAITTLQAFFLLMKHAPVFQLLYGHQLNGIQNGALVM